MTGMDVLRRVQAYGRDMERLRLRLRCTRDAATQCTRSADVTGHGGAEDRMGRYAALVCDIEQEIEARKQVQARDMLTVQQLLGEMEPMQGEVVYMRMVVHLTVRQVAGELKTSESSVRGLYRRGRETLEAITL